MAGTKFWHEEQDILDSIQRHDNSVKDEDQKVLPLIEAAAKLNFHALNLEKIRQRIPLVRDSSYDTNKRNFVDDFMGWLYEINVSRDVDDTSFERFVDGLNKNTEKPPKYIVFLVVYLIRQHETGLKIEYLTMHEDYWNWEPNIAINSFYQHVLQERGNEAFQGIKHNSYTHESNKEQRELFFSPTHKHNFLLVEEKRENIKSQKYQDNQTKLIGVASPLPLNGIIIFMRPEGNPTVKKEIYFSPYILKSHNKKSLTLESYKSPTATKTIDSKKYIFDVNLTYSAEIISLEEERKKKDRRPSGGFMRGSTERYSEDDYDEKPRESYSMSKEKFGAVAAKDPAIGAKFLRSVADENYDLFSEYLEKEFNINFCNEHGENALWLIANYGDGTAFEILEDYDDANGNTLDYLILGKDDMLPSRAARQFNEHHLLADGLERRERAQAEHERALDPSKPTYEEIQAKCTYIKKEDMLVKAFFGPSPEDKM